MAIPDFEELNRSLASQSRVAIVDRPTPVRRLSKLFPNDEVWLKDDSVTHPVYGGNKPRKLEYLIAQALKNKQEVVTFGFENSNHALAAAYHCKLRGVPCHLILVKAPSKMSDSDRRLLETKKQLVRKYAQSIHIVDNFAAAFVAGTLKWFSRFKKLMVIPPGGSNAVGTLGYVQAAIELAGQVHQRKLPEPEKLFVALGTGGTAVGLAIGLRAAGLKTKVHAVRVVPGSRTELPALKRLARRSGKILRLHPECFDLENLVVDSSALGAGYAAPTEESELAVQEWAKEEAVELETTYTGKVAAALKRELSKNPSTGACVFWLTYSAPKLLVQL
ncbi:MAG: pyridoxal-phosphate dependent enzyme [Bdellovibrionota bacterium]